MTAKFKRFPTQLCNNCGHNTNHVVTAEKGNMERVACLLCGHAELQEVEKC